MTDEDLKLDYPCPACGFITLDDSPGSYMLCEVCDWEDAGVQLRFPLRGGGANRKSLCEYQKIWVEKIPLDTTEHKGYTRVQNWRPLSSEEILEAQIFDEANKSLPESPPYYWER